MSGFDRQRMVGALMLAASALYLMAVAPRFRYRRVTRALALTIYAIAFGAVVVWIVMWMEGLVTD
jgi:hypothetical protein